MTGESIVRLFCDKNIVTGSRGATSTLSTDTSLVRIKTLRVLCQIGAYDINTINLRLRRKKKKKYSRETKVF